MALVKCPGCKRYTGAVVGALFYPLGFLLQLVGEAVLLKANAYAAGYYQVFCPNCGRPGILPGKSVRYRCAHCTRESTVTGACLYPR